MQDHLTFIPSTIAGQDQDPLSEMRPKALVTARSLAPLQAIPGHNFLGKTYDVIKGGETPHPDSFGIDLIDRRSLSWREYPVGRQTYQVPEILSDAGGVHHGDLRIIESDKTEEYASKIGGSVEASVSYGLFEGSLHSSFSVNESRYSNRKFGSATDLYQQYSMRVVDPDRLRESMTQRVLKLIDGGDPAEVVEELGTHYIAGLIVGGRAQASFTVDTSSYKSDMSVEATIKASYSYGIGKASATVKSQYEKSQSSWESSTRREVQLVGGDERLARSIMAGKYDEWLKSLDQTPAAVGFPGNGLRGIWHLAKDRARQQAIKKAAIRYIEGFQPLGRAPTLPLQVGDVLAFIAANGQHISRNDRPDTYLRAIGSAASHSVFPVKSIDGRFFTLYASSNKYLGQYYDDLLLAYASTINYFSWWDIQPASQGRYRIKRSNANKYWQLPSGQKVLKLKDTGSGRDTEFDVLVLGPKLG